MGTRREFVKSAILPCLLAGGAGRWTQAAPPAGAEQPEDARYIVEAAFYEKQP